LNFHAPEIVLVRGGCEVAYKTREYLGKWKSAVLKIKRATRFLSGFNNFNLTPESLPDLVTDSEPSSPSSSAPGSPKVKSGKRKKGRATRYLSELPMRDTECSSAGTPPPSSSRKESGKRKVSKKGRRKPRVRRILSSPLCENTLRRERERSTIDDLPVPQPLLDGYSRASARSRGTNVSLMANGLTL